ncbi:hypothetical protein R3P38DRAFT_2496238, partial [Favolaschia claudopus]
CSDGSLSSVARREAILWYHRESMADGRMFNANKVNNCLKSKHKIMLVGDAEVMARKTMADRHKSRRDCRCAACSDGRVKTNCAHPNQCFAKARAMLMSLDDKWNPLIPQPEDYEDEDGDEDHPETEQHDEECRTFDTRISQPSLADTFRIFCDGTRGSNRASNLRMEPEPDEEDICVYTDAKTSQTANSLS